MTFITERKANQNITHGKHKKHILVRMKHVISFGLHGLASSLAFIQFTSGDTAVFVNPEKSVNTVR